MMRYRFERCEEVEDGGIVVSLELWIWRRVVLVLLLAFAALELDSSFGR